MNTADYKKIAHVIPPEPGIYQYIDKTGQTIYVGKAKSLKNRISSYFGNKKHISAKTRTMLRNAEKVEFTVVDSEQDALLLESTLIKNLQPRYNVMLKDGKSYVYIRIMNERFPRVFLTRKVIRDGSTYFGPYASKYRARVLLELIKSLFKLRTCTLNLSEKNILAEKFSVCLEYHIKNCEAPCVQYETEDSYNQKITQIKNILKGNFAAVKSHLSDQMHHFADLLDFERAQEAKEKFSVFDDYQGKSTVVSTTIRDLDVFSIETDETTAYVNYIKIIDGAMIHAHTSEMVMNLNQDKVQLLSYAIPLMRKQFQSIASEIIVPFEVFIPDQDFETTIPKIGDKKKLLDLSEKNLKLYILQKKKDEVSKNPKIRSEQRIMQTLQKDLQMDQLPVHIECFDNSNIMGTNPVSSCVVFRNAKPAKKDYRHYNIKTVQGPDDFASMEEVVFRRYRRLLDEEKSLPQLIIIDGGKGQLSASVKSLQALEIQHQVTIIGVAKRLEEIFFPGDTIPIYINKKSESLKLIQHARNEAHRFAINFHRLKRSKGMINSELSDIPGVGPKTVQKLIGEYGSLRRIREASPEDIETLIGKGFAKRLFDYFEGE